MSAPHMNTIGEGSLRRLMARESYDGKMEIERVSQPDDTPFKYTVVDTMMRIDLLNPSHHGRIALSSTLIGTTESTMQRPSGHARAMNILKMMATRSCIGAVLPRMAAFTVFTAGITVSA